MIIRKTLDTDLNEVLHLFANARKFMEENGNKTQWVNGYPQKSVLEKDILKGHSYVCIDQEKIVGTFYFAIENDPTYSKIDQGSWLNDAPYGVVHRITTDRSTKGIGAFCINWCLSQWDNIRVDTHENNVPMDRLLQKCGFSKCGIIYIANGDERIAYHFTAS